MRAKWAPHAGKVGPGRLCPVFCPTLPKPWAKWAIVFISFYLTCLVYIIRYRLKRASIAYHMHISRDSCNYLICGRQFIYPMCQNSCTARFARPSPMCVNPLASDNHRDSMINIVTGRMAPPSVNVDKVLEIGKRKLEKFESKSPDGFYDTITKQVETMSVIKKIQ